MKKPNSHPATPSVKGHLSLLGHRVKDRVTGTTGVVDSVCFDLYGCVQGAINQGIDKDGKAKESRWFDVKRLERIAAAPVMAAPDFDLPEIGAAEKPAR